MSGRPTPETDAEIEGIRNSIKKEYQFDWAIEVARKLERERDEAREALRTLAEHGENEIKKLIKERDEARNKMADALQEVDLRTLDYLRIREAIIATLEENRHLADGDDCTLAKLKSVVPDWK